MRIQVRKSTISNASVLVVTLVIAAVIGSVLASYLILVQQQSRSIARSQVWNNVMPIAEAGIEEGLQKVNQFIGTDKVWTTGPSDGWSQSGNVYSITRSLDGGASYTIVITNGASVATIRSTGSLPLPPALGSSNRISRTVLIRATPDAWFNAAMAALGSIYLKGSGVSSDSFDSSATNYPGYWTNTLRRANGDIVSNSSITNSVNNLGNGSIAGHVGVGPGGIMVIGSQGVVGSIPFVDNSANDGKIEDGYARNDMNVVFSDVKLPETTWKPATKVNATAPDGKTYDYIFQSSGDYSLPADVSFSGTIYVATNVSIRVYIKADTFKPGGIYVAGTGTNSGKMVGYLQSSSVTLGSECQIQSKFAERLQFLGLPSCTDIGYNGNGDFCGVIYAPQADFHLAGGGSGIIDFIGASVTKTVQMNGHYHFHYDEHLKISGPNNGYIATFWKEL